jgi:hypothetical protein
MEVRKVGTKMTPEEINQLNDLVNRLPKGKRKALWDRLNNSGYKTGNTIDSCRLRASLNDTERRGLRWLQNKKEVA